MLLPQRNSAYKAKGHKEHLFGFLCGPLLFLSVFAVKLLAFAFFPRKHKRRDQVEQQIFLIRLA